MTTFQLMIRAGLLAIALSVIASPAIARNDILDFSVEQAKSIGPSENLGDIPFYMAKKSHPGVAKDLGVHKTTKTTNKFNKPDENACAIAFLSGIIQLQKRARELGGNAIVDVTSVTKGQTLESATEYRCNLGTFTALVGLTGRVVKLK